MKRIAIQSMILVLGLLLLAGPCPAQDATAAALADLASPTAEVRMAAVGTLAAAGAGAIDSLFAAMGGENRDAELAAQMAVARMVQNAGRPGAEAEREAVADALLRVVNADRPPALQRWALEQLSFVAGAAQVPALAALLQNSDLRESARWTLVRTPGQEATDALAAALETADAGLAVGLVDALGVRGAVGHIDAVIVRVSHADPGVRRAAIEALGRIPAAAGEPVLRTVLTWDLPLERRTAETSYARLAQLLAAGGDRELAREMFEYLYVHGTGVQLRCAGLRGLARIAGDDALRTLQLALDSPEGDIRGVAVEELAALRGRGVSRALAQRHGTVRTQCLLLDILGRRGDRSVTMSIADSLDSESEAVRLAALGALGALADERAVPRMTPLLGSESEAERDAAYAALERIPGERATRALVEAYRRSAGAERAALVQILSHRDVPGIVEILREGLQDPDPRVRLAAIRSMGNVRDEALVRSLVELAATGSPEEAAAAEAALDAQPESLALGPLMEAADSADPAVRAVAVRALSRRSVPDMRPRFMAAAESDHEALALAGIAGLAQLKDEAALDLLMRIARNGSPTLKIAATDAYLDIVDQIKEEAGGERKLELYHEMLRVAAADRQRIRTLDGLARFQSPKSVPFVLQSLESDSRAVRAAAGRALIPITDNVGIAGEYERAKQLYLAAVKECTEPGMIRIAAEHIGMLQYKMDPGRDVGFLAKWWLLGPLPHREDLLDHDAIPTSGPVDLGAVVRVGEATAAWTYKALEDVGGIMDLDAVFGQQSNCGAYAYTQVTSDEDREILLKAGSDDDLYVWVNGELVHRWNGNRNVLVDDMLIPARLTKGTNHILLKVLETGGMWGFCVRPATPDGRTLILEQP